MTARRRAADAIVGLLGVLLCALGSFGVHGDLAILFVSVGAALLAVVVIDAVWWWVGGEPAEERVKELKESFSDVTVRLDGLPEVLAGQVRGLSDVQLLGITRASRTNARASEGDFWAQTHSGCRRHVDLCGRAMLGWFRPDDGAAFEQTILENLALGCRYRILIYRPYQTEEEREQSSFAGDIESVRPSRIAVQHTQESLVKLMGLRAKIALKRPDYAPRFEIKTLRPYVITMLISRFDDVAVTAPYPAHTTSSDSPHFVVSKGAQGSLFRWLGHEFAALWREGQDLDSDEELLAMVRAWSSSR